jgi:hypothetical protein
VGHEVMLLRPEVPVAETRRRADWTVVAAA